MSNLVDGNWGEWGQWSNCGYPCEGEKGTKVRERECNNPAPENGGDPCIGDEEEYQTCEFVECVVTTTSLPTTTTLPKGVMALKRIIDEIRI